MDNALKILIYGYGNPGRQDDGLGNELVNRMEKWAHSKGLTHVHFESNYQLNIEDAEIISKFDLVVFADASVEELENVALTRLDGKNELSFTSHAASPGYVVHLCAELFGRIPESYLLHIKGYEWDFREGLSHEAGKNLEVAFTFMTKILSDHRSLSDKKFIIHNS